jgi:hypothetical protein
MKRRMIWSLVVIALLVSAWVVAAGGGYEIPWNSVDGGGGMSSNGRYEMLGSMGQPDAGELSGGSYDMTGGYLGITQLLLTNPLNHPIYLPVVIRDG